MALDAPATTCTSGRRGTRPHGYWIPLTVSVVAPGLALGDTRHGRQRLVGNIGGLALTIPLSLVPMPDHEAMAVATITSGITRSARDHPDRAAPASAPPVPSSVAVTAADPASTPAITAGSTTASRRVATMSPTLCMRERAAGGAVGSVPMGVIMPARAMIVARRMPMHVRRARTMMMLVPMMRIDHRGPAVLDHHAEGIGE